MRNEVFTSSGYRATIHRRIEEMVMGQAQTMQRTDDDLDGVVDEVLRAAGGDVRAAILGLVRGQHQLVAENATRVSSGYVRRAPTRA